MKNFKYAVLTVSFLAATYANALTCNDIFANPSGQAQQNLELKQTKESNWVKRFFGFNSKQALPTLPEYLNEHRDIVEANMTANEIEQLPKALKDLKQEKVFRQISSRLEFYRKTLDAENIRSSIKARYQAEKTLQDLWDVGGVDRVSDKIKQLFIDVEVGLVKAEKAFGEIKKLEAMKKVIQQDSTLDKSSKKKMISNIEKKIQEHKLIASEASYFAGKKYEDYIQTKRQIELVKNKVGDVESVQRKAAKELETKLQLIVKEHNNNQEINLSALDAELMYERNILAKLAHKKQQAVVEFGVSARGIAFNPVLIKYFSIIINKTPLFSRFAIFRDLLSIVLGMDQQAHLADIYGTKILAVLDLENSAKPDALEAQYQMLRLYNSQSEAKNGFLDSFYLNPEMKTDIWGKLMNYAKSKADTKIDGTEDSRAVYFYEQMQAVVEANKSSPDRHLSSGKPLSYRAGIYLTMLGGIAYWQYADPSSTAHEVIQTITQMLQ